MTDPARVVHVVSSRPHDSRGDLAVRINVLLAHLDLRYSEFNYVLEGNTLTIDFANSQDALEFIMECGLDSQIQDLFKTT